MVKKSHLLPWIVAQLPAKLQYKRKYIFYFIYSLMSIKIKSECSIRTPFEHSVTIPSDTSLPESVSGECKCYYIQPRLHRLGMIYAKTTFGNQVRCYNAERSICDMLRSRNRMDEETVISSLKKYAAWKD